MPLHHVITEQSCIKRNPAHSCHVSLGHAECNWDIWQLSKLQPRADCWLDQHAQRCRAETPLLSECTDGLTGAEQTQLNHVRLCHPAQHHAWVQVEAPYSPGSVQQLDVQPAAASRCSLTAIICWCSLRAMVRGCTPQQLRHASIQRVLKSQSNVCTEASPVALQCTHLLLYSNLLLQLASLGLVSSCLLVTQLLLQNLWVISLPHAGGPRPVL